jgi:hypothetical protein
MELKDSLQNTLNHYIPNELTSKIKGEKSNYLGDPKSSLVIVAILSIVLCSLTMFLHMKTRLIFFKVDPVFWQTFINSAWAVHTSVLTISVTLLVFLVQGAGTTKNERISILDAFTKKYRIYFTLYWGLIGIIIWGITASFASNPKYPYLSASFLTASIVNSITTILLILFIYSNITKVFDSKWKNELYEEILINAFNRDYLNFSIVQLTNVSILTFQNLFFDLFNPNNDTNLKSIKSKTSGYIVDIDFKSLKKALESFSQGEAIKFYFGINTFINKGEEILKVSDSISQTEINTIINCFKIKKKKEINSLLDIEYVLDTISTELSKSIRSFLMADIKHYFQLYLSLLNSMYQYQKKTGITNEGFFSFSPLDYITHNMAINLVEISEMDNQNLSVSVSRTLYRNLIDSYQENNFSQFIKILQFYQYFLSSSIGKRASSKSVLDSSLRHPYEILMFRSKDNEQQELYTEILNYYTRIFYQVSKTNKLDNYLSMFITIKALQDLSVRRSKELQPEIRNLIFTWTVWLVYRFEEKKITTEDFFTLFEEIKVFIPNRYILALALRDAMNGNGRNLWENWEEDDKEDNIIRVGVRTFSSNPRTLSFRAYALTTILLPDGYYDNFDKMDFSSISYYIKDTEQYALNFLHDEEIKQKSGIQEVESVIANLSEFHNSLIRLVDRQWIKKIIESPISDKKIKIFEEEQNKKYIEAAFPEKFFSFFGSYNEELITNSNLKLATQSILMKKSSFINSSPGFYDFTKELRLQQQKKLFSMILNKCTKVQLAVSENKIINIIDSLINEMELLNKQSKLILVPWGTITTEEFGDNDDFSLKGIDLRVFYGTYRNCPIIWLPESNIKKIAVLDSASLGTWKEGLIQEEGNTRHLSISVSTIEPSLIKSFVRNKIKKNKSEAKEYESKRDYYKQLVIVKYKNYNIFNINENLGGCYSELDEGSRIL